MRRTILGLLAVALPFIGAPMGVKAEGLNAKVPQPATSMVVTNTLATPSSRRLSTREEAAQIRAIRKLLEDARTGSVSSEQQSEPPPIRSAIQVAPVPVAATTQQEPVAPAAVVVSTPQQEQAAPSAIQTDLIRPSGSLPQKQAGERWKPIRIHTEVRSRPNDLTIDAKAEVVTKGGWMTGAQFVTQSGSFSGENLKEVWNGQYTDTRSEFWAGRHGRSQDDQTRWSVNGFVRQLTHEDSGKGQSRPGAEYPYSYTWRNAPNPLTQVGVRARVERDVIRNYSQQLTIHLKGEAAATVSGNSGWAYDVQAGVWYRTPQVEVYAEAGVNNTGAYANGYGRYYLTSTGQLKPFAEVRVEGGSGYHNTQVGGGLQIGIGKNAYAEGVLGYNTGTSGDGMAATLRAGFRF